MVGAAGIEPATTGLENRCSIQLSYAPVFARIVRPQYRTAIAALPEMPHTAKTEFPQQAAGILAGLPFPTSSFYIDALAALTRGTTPDACVIPSKYKR